MRIFSQYVFRQASSALLLILASLSGIVWIALALRQLNVVTSQGQDTLMLIKMTTLALPNLMAIIAPFSYLIASLHTLNRLNTDSELIVLTASGSTVWAAARPLLLLAVLVSVFLGVVNHVVQPWSMRQLRDFMLEVRTDLLTQVIQPGRFSSPETGLMFHIRERSFNGELIGLVMHDTRDQSQAQTYLAERGVIVKQDDSAFLVMTSGHILRRAEAKEPAQIVAFDKYAVDLDRFEPQSGGASELKPRERYLSELLDPGADSAIYKRQPGLFRSELHERLSNPLYPIAFALIIIAFVGQARSTRTSRMESLVVAFVLAAGCRLTGLALTNLVTANAAYTPIMYALPVGAMIVSLVVIKGADRQRTGLAVVDRVVAATGNGASKLKRLLSRSNSGAGPRAGTGPQTGTVPR